MKKITILTGAGSAFPWDGPSCAIITNKLINDNKFITKSGQTLGKYLYDLLTNYYNKDPLTVNFETIIDLVETLFDFYQSSSCQGFSEFKTSVPIVFQIKQSLFNEVLDLKNIYSQSKIGFENINYSKNKFICLSNQNQYMGFFESLYHHFINLVIDEISIYCKSWNNNKYTLFNSELQNFFNYLKGTKNDNIIRYYTTTYDRLLIDCLNSKNVKIFDGFDLPDTNFNGTQSFFRQNTGKILTDNTIDCHYSLHGSIYFKIEATKLNKDIEWVCNPSQISYSDFGTSHGRNQSGKQLIASNIITGLDKPSRILISPNNEFYTRFSSDCIESDLIIVIGYSFSDYHLNKSIQNRLHINNPQIYNISYVSNWVKNNVIDPWDDEWEDFNKMKSPDYFDDSIGNSSSNWIMSQKGIQQLYWKGYQEFLIKNEWSKIIV